MGFDYSVRLGLMCFFHYNSVSFLLFSFKRFTPQCLRVCTRVQWQPEQTWSLISWGFWSHGEVDINTVIILVVTYLQSDARAVKKRKRKTCLQLIKERTPDWWGCSASLNMMSEQRTEPWCGRNPTERRRRMGRVVGWAQQSRVRNQALGRIWSWRSRQINPRFLVCAIKWTMGPLTAVTSGVGRKILSQGGGHGDSNS